MSLLPLWLVVASMGSASAAPPGWPQPDAPLERLPQRPAVGPRKTVMLSAGHGTGSNIGNVGVHGQLEQDTTLALATELAERLRSLDRFDVVLAREGAERPSYAQRVEEAERLGVDVLVELHTDLSLIHI